MQQSDFYYHIPALPSFSDFNIVMDRDRRLTGFLRGQTDNPSAPLGFELNSPWRVCHSIAFYCISPEDRTSTDTNSPAREKIPLGILLPPLYIPF